MELQEMMSPCVLLLPQLLNKLIDSLFVRVFEEVEIMSGLNGQNRPWVALPGKSYCILHFSISLLLGCHKVFSFAELCPSLLSSKMFGLTVGPETRSQVTIVWNLNIVMLTTTELQFLFSSVNHDSRKVLLTQMVLWFASYMYTKCYTWTF